MRNYSMTHIQTPTAVNLQLRAYFVQVYRMMSFGLVVSALCAWLAAHPPVIGWLYSSNAEGYLTLSYVGWAVLLAPFILVFNLRSAVRTNNPTAATITFYLFSTLMGLSLSSIFLTYAPGTIFSTFLICAIMFASLSIYGQTTQRDLSSWGSILGMGVWGLLIALLVNMFLQKPAFDYAISLIGVAIFTGLVAYDTQRIRQLYNESPASALRSTAITAALILYLDFINLFLFLLRLIRQKD